jgi:hypothetical protein
VTTLEDATRGQMRDAIRAFGGWIARGGVGLFYFAGHGMQVMGRNYLLPVGTELTREDQVEGETVGLDSVLAELETARNRLNILILDACRNNPFGTGLGGGQGFTQVDAPAGTYLAFATSPGRTAADGNGANSTYTGALLRQLKIPGLKLEEVFKRARAEVLTASSQQQTPWETSSVVGDFCFVQGQDTVPAEPAVTTVVLPPTAVPSVPAPAAATVVLPPPPVPAAQVGGLQVLVDAPGAQIYVDGSLAGSASPTEALNLPGLPAGVVRVRAEAQGCSPVQQAFGIQPGQWTQARLVLRPSPGPAFAAPEEGVPMGSPPAPPGPPPFRRPPFRPLGPRADLSLPRPVRRWVR